MAGSPKWLVGGGKSLNMQVHSRNGNAFYSMPEPAGEQEHRQRRITVLALFTVRPLAVKQHRTSLHGTAVHWPTREADSLAPLPEP